jgi:hypothetical protein
MITSTNLFSINFFHIRPLYMSRRVRNIFRRALVFVTDATIGRITRRRRRNRATNESLDDPDPQNQDEHVIDDIAIPTLSQPAVIRHERAQLIDSSSDVFGNECLRLVNISFHTSQTFPLMMHTCATVSQYLRKELINRHSGEHLHIIIGENNAFGFTISDANYFAEIHQEQYRVIIFTTVKSRKIEYSAHDANSQMVLTWKPVLGKSLKK